MKCVDLSPYNILGKHPKALYGLYFPVFFPLLVLALFPICILLLLFFFKCFSIWLLVVFLGASIISIYFIFKEIQRGLANSDQQHLRSLYLMTYKPMTRWLFSNMLHPATTALGMEQITTIHRNRVFNIRQIYGSII